jgi:hypothetical protein
VVNLTTLLWDSSRIYATQLKEKRLVRLKGEAKLTKSEKTAPIDMLRTISSSSSVSDIVLVDEFRARERERESVYVCVRNRCSFSFSFSFSCWTGQGRIGPERKGPEKKRTKKL